MRPRQIAWRGRGTHVRAGRQYHRRGALVAWDEDRSFAYEGTGLPLVKRAHNVWSVQPENERQALLTTVAEVELKCGYFGRLLEPIMGAVFKRMAPSSLAAFKYSVEKGIPTRAGTPTCQPLRQCASCEATLRSAPAHARRPDRRGLPLANVTSVFGLMHRPPWISLCVRPFLPLAAAMLRS